MASGNSHFCSVYIYLYCEISVIMPTSLYFVVCFVTVLKSSFVKFVVKAKPDPN